MGWIFLAVLAVILIIVVAVWKSQHNTKLDRMRVNGKQKGMDFGEIERLVSAEAFPLPKWVNTGLIGLAVLFTGLGGFNQVFFYAEPGYIYHVRTILGQERVINGLGYSFYGFGRISPWKKGMTVQGARNTGASIEDQVDDSESNVGVSANLLPQNIVFLDQVDADSSATVRFRIPVNKDMFLELAHEYRTAANFLHTALIPAFKETLQSTASLMSAEEYFSGSRTEFNSEFEKQMRDGIYIVRRGQELVDDPTVDTEGSANATAGTNQKEFGNKSKVIFTVTKQYEADGVTLKRKPQTFTNFGVSVVEARVTEMIPNRKFVERMQLKQKASADRAIAREQRVQEEEQKLLAIARGDREVAERQAIWKADQIEQTTKAETDKQLALTAATKVKEQAAIQKDTSAIKLEQAKIDATTITTLADANAYEKAKLLEADNALQIKMNTEIAVQTVWAEAYAKRAVPQYVFGGSNGSGGTSVGGDSETANFMKLMTVEAAKNLAYSRSVQQVQPAASAAY